MKTEVSDREGLMIVLSSPSGAGKSTLTRMLIDWDPSLTMSVSATTRPMRPGEVEGQHYFFKSGQEFEAMVEGGALLEHATVFGNRYGTPQAPVAAALATGRDVLFDVDWQGAQQLRASALGRAVVALFILPPSIDALARRLVDRGQDDAAVIQGRMKKSMDEISHWAEYDYVLINDNLDQCFSQICTIVQAERLKRTRARGLVSFVRGLAEEYDTTF